MRRAAGLLAISMALAGCHLYFEEDEDPPPLLPIDGPFPFPPIDAGFPSIDAPPGACEVVAYCGEGGRLFRSTCLPGAPAVLPPDVYSTGSLFGGCASRACRDDSTFSVCPGGNCDSAQDLCRPVSTCAIAGSSCTGDATATCSEQVGCAVTAITDTCTCVDGAFACTPAADQVSPMLVGNWFASVTPPPFTEPYRGTLTFNNNRTYDAQRAGADALFFYGEDGGSDVFRWRPVGVTATGGVATVDIYFGTHSIVTALVTDIVRDGTRTSFTFWDSWLDCSRPFRFDAAPVTP